ncbi:MAG: FAD-dependent oxidoreductase [Calditrichaeota bacterium]|nr:FAD-dependent oxidoreductase [Calditrichota bacterium]
MKTSVLVAGGGTGGVCAAIQAARSGVHCILVEETPWLGGMLTAAGVSCTDGNHNLPSGLWGEFRKKLYDYYGGADAVATGWVSNTSFEPHVGERIFREMVDAEKNIDVIHGYWPVKILKNKKRVTDVVFENEKNEIIQITATITIDATEYGDILAMAGCDYHIGRDSICDTGEEGAPREADDIIQDITYVAILKDYGAGADKTIRQPPDYHQHAYNCTCRELCDDPGRDVVDAQTMLNYGRLPNNKFMVNWPVNGNDYYLNVISQSRDERKRELQKAKNFTLGWIYFIQTRGGFRNFGLAEDEFETRDNLPFIPYNRESRRLKGIVQLTVPDLKYPYRYRNRPLYQSGIAVGDYPLDHHHQKAPKQIEEKFPRIPAFTVPYGCLVPERIDGLLVAEKSISVTHLVNGTTRLQPTVMLIGQAAGAAAAVCVEGGVEPREIPLRVLQQNLLNAGCWLMPFRDVSPGDWFFQAVQKVAVCGLLKGRGIPKGWANEMRFYPLKNLSGKEFLTCLAALIPKAVSDFVDIEKMNQKKVISRGEALETLWRVIAEPKPGSIKSYYKDVQPDDESFLSIQYFHEMKWTEHWADDHNFHKERTLVRLELASMLDGIWDLFSIYPGFIEPQEVSDRKGKL